MSGHDQYSSSYIPTTEDDVEYQTYMEPFEMSAFSSPAAPFGFQQGLVQPEQFQPMQSMDLFAQDIQQPLQYTYSDPIYAQPDQYSYVPPVYAQSAPQTYYATGGEGSSVGPSYASSSSQPLRPTRNLSQRFLQPIEGPRTARSTSRSSSLASNASSSLYSTSAEISRSASPSVQEMSNWGYQNQHGTWSCAFPGCTSRSVFFRGCDLRKHYRRHTKTLFCRQPGCPQSTEGGFSSKKDRLRHEASHNPDIQCDWAGCDRMFSRADNMRDHYRRIHLRERTTSK